MLTIEQIARAAYESRAHASQDEFCDWDELNGFSRRHHVCRAQEAIANPATPYETDAGGAAFHAVALALGVTLPSDLHADRMLRKPTWPGAKAGVAELPRYQSHKTVWALEIESVDLLNHRLVPVDKMFEPIQVDVPWLGKHEPKAGMFFVVYEDGYRSVSPGDAFRAGNTLVQD